MYFRISGIADGRLSKLKKFITTDMTGKLFVSSYDMEKRKNFPDVNLNRVLDRAFLARWVHRRRGGLLSDSNGNALMGPSSTILYRLPESLQNPWKGLKFLGMLLKDVSNETFANILNSCQNLQSLVLLFGSKEQDQSSICSTLSASQSSLKQLAIAKTEDTLWTLDLENLELNHLTHLSLPMSAIYYEVPQNNNPQHCTGSSSSHTITRNGFKKSRLGVVDMDSPYLLPLSLTISGCPLIRVLEIGISEKEEMKLDHKIEEKVP